MYVYIYIDISIHTIYVCITHAMVYLVDYICIYTPSGKRLHNRKITICDGKTHYFDWAIFNSYVRLPEHMSYMAL